MRAAASDRWVVMDMAKGELAFDAYVLRPGGAAFSQAAVSQVFEQTRHAPRFRDRLTEDERDILDHTSIQVIIDGGLNAHALRRGEDYRITIGSDFYFFLLNAGRALLKHPEGGEGQIEEVSLLIMSEMDFMAGRPRWFWAPLYDWYRAGKGAPAPAVDPIVIDFFIRSSIRILLLHELCHHFAGDGDPRTLAKMLVLQESDPEKYREVSHASEIAADRCAAKHAAANDGDPRLSMSFLLIVSTLQSMDGNLSHPGGNARIKALRDLGDAIYDADLAKGADPIMVAKMRAAFSSVGDVTVDTAPAWKALENLRRGTWPTCPFGPQQGKLACPAQAHPAP